MAEEIKVLCPWCNKGEVYIEGAGNANVSMGARLMEVFL